MDQNRNSEFQNKPHVLSTESALPSVRSRSGPRKVLAGESPKSFSPTATADHRGFRPSSDLGRHEQPPPHSALPFRFEESVHLLERARGHGRTNTPSRTEMSRKHAPICTFCCSRPLGLFGLDIGVNCESQLSLRASAESSALRRVLGGSRPHRLSGSFRRETPALVSRTARCRARASPKRSSVLSRSTLAG